MLKENGNPYYSQEWCEDVVEEAQIDFRALMTVIVTSLKSMKNVNIDMEDIEHIGDAVSDAMLNDNSSISTAVRVLENDYDITASITTDFFGSYKQFLNKLMKG